MLHKKKTKHPLGREGYSLVELIVVVGGLSVFLTGSIGLTRMNLKMNSSVSQHAHMVEIVSDIRTILGIEASCNENLVGKNALSSSSVAALTDNGTTRFSVGEVFEGQKLKIDKMEFGGGFKQVGDSDRFGQANFTIGFIKNTGTEQEISIDKIVNVTVQLDGSDRVTNCKTSAMPQDQLWLASSSGIYSNNNKVGIGTSSPNAKLDVVGGDIVVRGKDRDFRMYSYAQSGSSNKSTIRLYRSRGDLGSEEAVEGQDQLGAISWYGYHTGDAYEKMAEIVSVVDAPAGIPQPRTMPARMEFRLGNPADPDPEPVVLMALFSDGSLDIGRPAHDPSKRLNVNGNIYSTGGIDCTSDRRFKTEINELPPTLKNLLKLRGVSYHWKSKGVKGRKFPKGKQFGVIAQEVEKIYPALVHTGPDGYKSVSYIKLIPILLQSIKEIDTKNKVLANNLKMREQKLVKLELKLAKLRKEATEIKNLIQKKNSPPLLSKTKNKRVGR